ncbi:MAG: hypothetical protein MR779_04595 [Tenericutes bacterium]|nr:hypothetical protein [Mycoplasmatota bacterium]
MKPLNLKETALKEEMKERCLTKGQYIDENAKAKFEMLCHLEDFEVQYWKLQKENEILKENAKNNDKVVDKVNWENQLLKKENKQLKKIIDRASARLEYFLIGNLKYQSSQEEFIKLVNILKEVSE